ncbi:MAG: hypothetical protein ACYDH1_05645 [Anaerolineaceae bacterium]
MNKFFAWVLLIIGVGLFSACSGLVPEPTPIPPTDTPTITPTNTATIVWFPPTETPTPIPTRLIEPTSEMRPGIGAVILNDGFSENLNWRTGTYSAGNIAQVDKSITLAVQQPKSFLITFLSEPSFDQFDVKVKVDVSLCRGEDAYGLLIRAASDWDYYRFLVNCNGNAKAERIRNSQTLPLQDWTPAGIIPGAPIVTNLEVWANGSEMRFFVNDVYIFTVKDPVFTSGQLGLMARSAGDTALTVNFQKLVVSELDVLKINSVTATP